MIRLFSNLCADYITLMSGDVHFGSGCFYLCELSLIPPWIGNNINYKNKDEITHPIQRFNGTAVEV